MKTKKFKLFEKNYKVWLFSGMGVFALLSLMVKTVVAIIAGAIVATIAYIIARLIHRWLWSEQYKK